MSSEAALIQHQLSIDGAVAEWIAQKKTTGSLRTAIEYARTMESFRQFLADGGLDVLPITAGSRRISIDMRSLSLVLLANGQTPVFLLA